MEFKPLQQLIQDTLDQAVGIDFNFDEEREALGAQIVQAIRRSHLQLIAAFVNGEITHDYDGQAIIRTSFIDPLEISEEMWEEYQNEEGAFNEEDAEEDDAENDLFEEEEDVDSEIEE